MVGPLVDRSDRADNFAGSGGWIGAHSTGKGQVPDDHDAFSPKSSNPFLFSHWPLGHQGEEGLESGSTIACGVELHSG
jgi:hypothetical protein